MYLIFICSIMLIYVTNFDFSLFEILEKISLCQFFLSVKILKPLKCIIFFDSDLVYDVILIVHSLRFRFILEFIEVDPLILEIWRSEKKSFTTFGGDCIANFTYGHFHAFKIMVMIRILSYLREQDMEIK